MDTTDIRHLVTDALKSLPPPYSEHVIDEVFFAIESSERLLQEYDGLCLKHSKTVVNTLGGYWIGRTLGKRGFRKAKSVKSQLIGSYSILDTDAKPATTRPKEAEARQMMSDFYREKRAELPPPSEMSKHREAIVLLIMDGASPEEAFRLVLQGDA